MLSPFFHPLILMFSPPPTQVHYLLLLRIPRNPLHHCCSLSPVFTVLLHSFLWSQYLHTHIPPPFPLSSASLSDFEGESSPPDPFISMQFICLSVLEVLLSGPVTSHKLLSQKSPGPSQLQTEALLFPGSGWPFAYSIPQPMYSSLLKHGSLSPSKGHLPQESFTNCF